MVKRIECCTNGIASLRKTTTKNGNQRDEANKTSLNLCGSWLEITWNWRREAVIDFITEVQF